MDELKEEIALETDSVKVRLWPAVERIGHAIDQNVESRRPPTRTT